MQMQLEPANVRDVTVSNESRTNKTTTTRSYYGRSVLVQKWDW